MFLSPIALGRLKNITLGMRLVVTRLLVAVTVPLGESYSIGQVPPFSWANRLHVTCPQLLLVLIRLVLCPCTLVTERRGQL